jgi:hypothetical protein
VVAPGLDPEASKITEVSSLPAQPHSASTTWLVPPGWGAQRQGLELSVGLREASGNLATEESSS